MSWWCVAWSEDVKDKPVAVRIGAEELVLFRDASGAVKVCEDRCPHRRVPLSMGWVTAKGTIQCGYHGWAYDGSSGQCVEIPNFRPGEPISQRVKVHVFPIAETQGAIFVHLDSAAAEDCPALAGLAGAGCPTGQTELAVAHSRWIESFIADPLAALGLDFQATGVRTQSDSGKGSVVIQLQARSGDASASVLAVCLEVWAQTGFSQLLVRDGAGAALLNALLSSLPLDADHTLIRWKLHDARSQNAVAVVLRKLFKGSAGIHIKNDVLRVVGAQVEPAALIWRQLQANEQTSAGRIRTIEER